MSIICVVIKPMIHVYNVNQLYFRKHNLIFNNFLFSTNKPEQICDQNCTIPFQLKPEKKKNGIENII